MGDYKKRQGALVHKTANLVGKDIELGEGTRIDAFVTMTGRIRIGRCVHISVGASVFGGAGVEIGDYSGLSVDVKVFTATEDMSGEWLMHPTSPEHLRRPKVAPIRFGRHCTVGAGSVVLPGADFPDGACLGALSLCKAPLKEWSIYAGVPARFIRERCRRAALLEPK
jgi:galactoside O-acetyltransferase